MLTPRSRLLAQTILEMALPDLQAYMMSLRSDETQRVGQVLKLYHAERARTNLLDFVTYTHHDYRPAPFHRVLCGLLDQFARRKIRRLLVSLPPQFGKLLADNTDVLTAEGWKRHGDIQVGDFVYSPSGSPVRVMAVSEPGIANVVVTTTDGSEFYCHENHEWTLGNQTVETKALSTLHLLDLPLPQVWEKPTRAIRSVRNGPDKVGRCIQVNSPDGLYLIGKTLIPTHNSEIISRRFPAYCLGLNPHERFIAASYGQALATDMARDVQKIIDNPEYHDIFPLTTLEGSEWAPAHRIVHKREAEMFEVVGARGYYKGAGIGGPITGRSATMGIVDDPFKDWADAMSQANRTTVWNWYKSVLFTRLQKDACICVLSTRWHLEDLIGMILEDAKVSGIAWTYVNMAAIQDQEPNEFDPRALGEPLWPSEYPLTRLHEMPAYRDPEIWGSLYQGRPTRQGGGIWKETFWRYWVPPGMLQAVRPIGVRQPDGTIQDAVLRELPAFQRIRMSGDLNFKKTGTSDVSLGVWGEAGADSFLLDEICDKFDFLESCDAIRRVEAAYPGISEKLVEDKANGSAAINALGTEIRDDQDHIILPAIPGLVPIEPKGSKVERANRVKPFLRAGNVYLPHPDIRADQIDRALKISRSAQWVPTFLKDCSDFPNGKRNDRIDQTSQYLQYRYLDPEVVQENQVASLWAKMSNPSPSIQQVKPASPKVYQYGA